MTEQSKSNKALAIWGNCQKKKLFHLFKIVKGRENDVVSSSDETHGSQQLQNKSFGPATTEEDGWDVDADS